MVFIYFFVNLPVVLSWLNGVISWHLILRVSNNYQDKENHDPSFESKS